MLTLNGVPTEKYQDLTVKGDVEFEGDFDFVSDNVVYWENEVVSYENETVTY